MCRPVHNDREATVSRVSGYAHGEGRVRVGVACDYRPLGSPHRTRSSAVSVGSAPVGLHPATNDWTSASCPKTIEPTEDQTQ